MRSLTFIPLAHRALTSCVWFCLVGSCALYSASMQAQELVAPVTEAQPTPQTSPSVEDHMSESGKNTPDLASATTEESESTKPVQSDIPLQHTLTALHHAQYAVVGISAVAAEKAMSNETLGREREGTGIVIGDNALILTIGYLIQESEQVMITTLDDRQIPARTIAFDPATGFGLVQPIVPVDIAAPVPIGSYNTVEEGELLTVMKGGEQNDGGWGDVDSRLLVSKRSFSAYWEYAIDQALFTAPPLSQHSGAVLFNAKGELVGLGNLVVSDVSEDDLKIPGNVFIPVDTLQPILQELIANGSTQASHRPWLGVTALEQNGRILIQSVTKASPAETAGLMSGDLILELNNQPVDTLSAFYKKLWSLKIPQTTVELTVVQGTQVRKIQVHTMDKLQAMAKPENL